MNTAVYLFLLGSAGAVAAEVLKLWEYRGSLASKKYQALLHSPQFWTLFFGMIVASGFIAWAVNAPAPTTTPLQVVLTGIGARGIVRGAAEAKTANSEITLGGDPDRLTLRDILS